MRKSLIIAISWLLSACASTVGRLPQLPDSGEIAYILGAGDVLEINVFGEPELSGTYRVSDSGLVAMPLAQAIPAQGLNLEGFRRQVVERLDTSAVKLPNVTVSISEYRPFFILGEVKNPGSYPYVPNMSVLTAVAIAGGFTYRASQNEISVTRQAGATAREWRAARDSRVLPGDVVYIFERHL